MTTVTLRHSDWLIGPTKFCCIILILRRGGGGEGVCPVTQQPVPGQKVRPVCLGSGGQTVLICGVLRLPRRGVLGARAHSFDSILTLKHVISMHLACESACWRIFLKYLNICFSFSAHYTGVFTRARSLKARTSLVHSKFGLRVHAF